MAYIFVFIILSINSVLERVVKSKVFLIFSAIMLVFFAGLRGLYVGTDTVVYAGNYQSIINKIGISYFEPGYSLLEHICAFFSLPTTLFFIIVALVSILFLTIGFNFLTLFPTSALLYYYSRFFLNREMNQIRAALAASIILFAFRYVIERKPLYYLLFCIIAFCFHRSAALAVFIYPFNYYLWNILKYKKKVLIFSISIITIAVILSFFASGTIYNIFSHIASSYVDENSNGAVSLGLSNPVIFMQILITIFSILLLSKEEIDDKIKVIFSSYLIATVLLILLSHYSVLAGRLSSIYATGESILLLKLVNHFFGTKISSCIIYIIIALFFFWLINFSSGTITPYTILI